MQTIITDITINAPANKVWSVLNDFEKYPQWNPFVTSITGNITPGNQINVQLEPPGGGKHLLKPVVLTLDENKEFRWQGKLIASWLFVGEHYFKLEAISENETKLIHGEKFTGLLVKPILSSVKSNTIKGFEAMNSALKTKVENELN